MNPRIFWQISPGSCTGTKAMVTKQRIQAGGSMVCLKSLIKHQDYWYCWFQEGRQRLFIRYQVNKIDQKYMSYNQFICVSPIENYRVRVMRRLLSGIRGTWEVRMGCLLLLTRFLAGVVQGLMGSAELSPWPKVTQVQTGVAAQAHVFSTPLDVSEIQILSGSSEIQTSQLLFLQKIQAL